jgi:hypothetical protein
MISAFERYLDEVASLPELSWRAFRITRTVYGSIVLNAAKVRWRQMTFISARRPVRIDQHG